MRYMTPHFILITRTRYLMIIRVQSYFLIIVAIGDDSHIIGLTIVYTIVNIEERKNWIHCFNVELIFCTVLKKVM